MSDDLTGVVKWVFGRTTTYGTVIRMLDFIPEPYRAWAWTFIALTLAAAAAALFHAIVYSLLGRLTRRTSHIADSSLVSHTRAAARVVFALVAIQLVLPATPLGEAARGLLRHLVAVGLIGATTWLVIRTVSVVDDVIMGRYRIDVEDNLQARRIHTQTQVVSRTVMILIAVIGFSAVLMTFPRIRQLGATLLASAGVAGLVIGLAARPTLANLIAGIQLALTQPIRLDDVVIVEGEWGRVEEITATFVVICIWDRRRLVVPLEYFLNHPFQNWTRRTADILGTVIIHADYTVPVQAVRAELERIVRASEKWDGQVCGLQVTDATERTVALRALVSAADSSRAWDLRCEVREKLIAYLQEAHPGCLPRMRAELDSTRDGDAPSKALGQEGVRT